MMVAFFPFLILILLSVTFKDGFLTVILQVALMDLSSFRIAVMSSTVVIRTQEQTTE